MLDSIKKVEDNWDYLYNNYDYARINFYNEYMQVKSVELKNLDFTPLYNDDYITIDKIKKFYEGCLNENWNMDLENFKENYKNLIELTLYDDTMLIIKFQKEKYYKFFNINKGYADFGTEKFFFPYSFKLEFKYTTFDDKKENASIQLVFGSYVDDTLILNKVISHQLTIKTEPLCLPDYIILLLNKDNKTK